MFGLWLMSHGAGPGESIMIVLGLPVVLFGVMPTIIGFTKFPEKKKPDVPELGLEQSPKKRDRFPAIEGAIFFWTRSSERVLLGSRECVYDLRKRARSSSPTEILALIVAQSTV